jgi:hypothetical protein
MSDKQLVKKLAEVMMQVKYIPKNGYNEFNRYKYATEADVNEKVREELAKRNIIMIPSVKSHQIREHVNRKGNTEYIATVEVEFTFMDGDTGETISFTTYGEGQDAGDKGTYKAITGAQKYALMKAFMIPTGDDPEADRGVDERNAQNDTSDEERELERQTKLNHVLAKWQTLSGEKDTTKAKESLEAFLNEKWKKTLETVTLQDLKTLEQILANQLLKKAQEQKKKGA